MTVSDLGEFGLIDRLAKAVGAQRSPDLILGIGDDAAAWRFGDSVLLATTDTLVEGVHFLPSLTPYRDLGWKALAVNVSDIAAMGGEPLFALVTLTLPPETPVSAVDDLYAGLNECAAEYAVTIGGGDVVRAPQLAITIALLGRASLGPDGAPRLLRRDAARPGQAVAVTGTLGDSAAGLRRLREGATPDDPLVRAHLHPHPLLAVAREAAALSIPCGIDISDGLLADLGHVCEMSGVSAGLEAARIPLSDALRAAYPDDALALACSGGEDYQLLLAGPPDLIDRLSASHPLAVIGRITDDPARRVRLLDASGREIALPAAGWDHLRRSRPSGRTP